MRDEARGLGAAFDAQDLQRLADALVDRVRRNLQLGRDFLGRKVLVDEAQAIELALAQLFDALLQFVIGRGGFGWLPDISPLAVSSKISSIPRNITGPPSYSAQLPRTAPMRDRSV